MSIKKSLAMLVVVIIVSFLVFLVIRVKRTPQLTNPPQSMVATPSPLPAFEYEIYDKISGTSGPKTIFFTDLFFPRNVGMYNDLVKLANKGVLRFTVRYFPSSSGLRSDPQKIGEKLVIVFTNCVKLLYPDSYTNYLITLQDSYLASNPNSAFNKAEDLTAFLKSNLPNSQKSGVIKCVQENSYVELANKEADYNEKFDVTGSPNLYFPDSKKHIFGYNDSDYFISQLWNIMDLSSFGYKKIDVQQQIENLVK